MGNVWPSPSSCRLRSISLATLQKAGQTMPSPWPTLWATMLAWAWLLPNHYLPWSSFHSDTWSAIVVGSAVAVILLLSHEPVVWHALPVLAAGTVVIPLIQYFCGLISFAGEAWISSLYLLGLMFALLTGARWERIHPHQLADSLFLAIGGASILSVGLQLTQWLRMDLLDLWSMGMAHNRPYANFGQPNQLGTFLLWGLLATAWMNLRGKIRAPAAVLMACFLCVGIALTQSRAAWIGLLLLVGAAWLGRKWWPSPRASWTITGIAVFFVAVYSVMGRLADLLFLEAPIEIGKRLTTHTRLSVWNLFIDAASQRPWFGYGWTGLSKAQLAVALKHPSLDMIFDHSHNLFLDLILWCGFPIGIFIFALLILWFVRRVRAIQDAPDLLLLMFVAVIANHAMLEFPLQYAYFLLPTGMVMGVLDTRLEAKAVFKFSRWAHFGLFLITTCVFAGIIRDYFRVEDNFYAWRFEQAHVGTLPPRNPPQVLFLTQWREELRIARFEPKEDVSQYDVENIRNVARAFPQVATMYKWALSLAYTGNVREAQLVLEKTCNVTSPDLCEIVERSWEKDSLRDPKIASIPWPKSVKLPALIN